MFAIEGCLLSNISLYCMTMEETWPNDGQQQTLVQSNRRCQGSHIRQHSENRYKLLARQQLRIYNPLTTIAVAGSQHKLVHSIATAYLHETQYATNFSRQKSVYHHF